MLLYFINAGYIVGYRCIGCEGKFLLVCGAIYIVMLRVPAACRVTSFMKTEKGDQSEILSFSTKIHDVTAQKVVTFW